jgi:hypothetical protein
MNACVVLLSVLILTAGLWAQEAATPPPDPIPLQYFGMHIHRAHSTTPWPPVPFGSWRLWDSHVQWPFIEPNKGDWHFEILDKEVALAQQHNVDVLMPLGLSPQWTSARPNEPSGYQPGFAAEPRMDDWRDFIRHVATRYKGRIHYYEVWNEPNLKEFFTGTPGQMVALAREAYKILKEVDPSIKVVSPSATAHYGVPWLDKYLNLGGGNYADIIGYHFYVHPNPPEDMVPLINSVKATMGKYGFANKPLWNTEFGYDKRKSFSSDEEAYAYLARALILTWPAGVSRIYWYAWDQTVYSLRLTQNDQTTLTAAGQAFAQVEKWLMGSQISSCSRNSDGLWKCRLTAPDGTQEEIVWHPDHETRIRPGNGGASAVEELTKVRKSTPSYMDVGISPVLLQLQAR